MRVHYFSDAGDGTTRATVRFYINGFLMEEFERDMERNDIWEAGSIRWEGGEGVVLEEDVQNYVTPAWDCY